ncbi:diguanylate cyclase [Undibacterium sp. Jales W-56]|uniref:tetratricopeptide repeat-containing diguanylate cyclase n=1 Tax=Undibacterium sp. Jales W-56 TaxID=2897325 RepID=UPI0021D2AE9F|nr:diguanylate cyclase [Undibacterium sp. Jales W-56]MCU6434790.1 diguanylate cyclase [Undibacterium sp. Jales W-56]
MLQLLNYRLLIILCLILQVGIARAEEKHDMERLDAIRALSDSDNEEGLKQLKKFKDSLPQDADDEVRAQTYRTLVTLLYDAGRPKDAAATQAELLSLALERKDKDLIAFARLAEIYDLIEKGKQDLALAKLDDINKSIEGTKNQEVLMRIEVAYGSAYSSMGKFELALTHRLEALRLSELLPKRRIQSKLYRLSSLAGLYLDMHNPEKSLETVATALELSTGVNSPKLIGSLYSTRALALIDLERFDEALTSYQRALKIFKETKYLGMEALTLSNIADYYLRVGNYVEAERTARQALIKSEAAQDKSAILNSKANIGFALGGQGKIPQAMAYINGALKELKDADAKTDIESMLGEIGRMYEKAGMYKEALATVREQQVLSSELFRAGRAKAVAALQEQFDANQRKKQIELLARENQLKDAEIKNRRLQQIITMLAAAVTVMAGTFVYLLYRRVRSANEKLREANLQLEFHAVRDPLTGLYNRRSFVDMMKTRTLISDKERREDDTGNPDCLILMDIDHFKQINDTWGHAVGDSVLMEVAHRLKRAVRDTDMVLRWGGEEFLIYSPKSQPAQLTKLVERILLAIGEDDIQIGNIAIPVTVTAGFIPLPFSDIPEEICNWEKAIQMADMALYLGKAHGRNRAYGLARLLVPQEQAMKVLDHDLSAALSAGMVELIEVVGPVKLKAPAASEQLAS